VQRPPLTILPAFLAACAALLLAGCGSSSKQSSTTTQQASTRTTSGTTRSANEPPPPQEPSSGSSTGTGSTSSGSTSGSAGGFTPAQVVRAFKAAHVALARDRFLARARGVRAAYGGIGGVTVVVYTSSKAAQTQPVRGLKMVVKRNVLISYPKKSPIENRIKQAVAGLG
jgi:hypothetical protein